MTYFNYFYALFYDIFMERSIHRQLIPWSQKQNAPVLFLRGARRTGKTTCMDELGKHFDRYIRIDLTDKKEQPVFERSHSFDDLLQSVFFLKDQRRKGTKSLVFLDGIDHSKAARNWLPSFQKHTNGLWVAVSSSRSADTSFPSDHSHHPHANDLILRPYSFAEFLRAMGENSALAALDEVPFPDHESGRLLRLFHLYALIGGMPEIVEHYAANRELADLPALYEKLLEHFFTEIKEETSSAKRNILVREILQNAFPFASMRVTFNRFGNTETGSREAAEAFRILQKILFLQLLYPSDSVSMPVAPNFDRSPRLQILDTGMVNYFSGIQKQLFIADDLLSVFGGQIARHAATQEILSSQYNPYDNLNFWMRGKLQSTAEVDFVFPYGDLVIPVIIKEGEPGRLRSIHQFIDASEHPFAVRLWAKNLSVRQARTLKGKKFFLLNLPYFLAGKIHEHLEGFIRLAGS
jgi:uncharacterized protein